MKGLFTESEMNSENVKVSSLKLYQDEGSKFVESCQLLHLICTY
jgi:hypothetical protein